MIPRIRVFISSPGDVAAAREIAVHTLERLAQDYARSVQAIEPYLWQHEAMLASGHFQDSIEPPSAFDIVILIVWSRLGSPLPEHTAVRDYRGIDGRAPVTGTEWEYEEALASARARGAPDILVFRSEKPAAIDTQDRRRREEQVRQLEALDAFWARHFNEGDRFLGAYTRFDSDEEFASTLETQLRKLIEKRISQDAQRADASTRLWGQPPFRGLESYEFEHAAIFFGQEDVISRAMLQLAAAAQSGSAFLLVLGASGSGKSSLVKAGIAPRLFVPRRITGAAFVRRVIFRPGDAREGEDLFDALALRLTAQTGEDEGLPELVSPQVTVADLAAHLRGSGAEPAMPFRTALARVGEQARARGAMLAYESARLVLVVDQLEELFTNERITPTQRRRFVDLLAGLSRSGLVWVIATMRKDFWHRADETPELVRLAEGERRLELLPPTPSQLSLVIRRPAEAAAVTFEVNPATGIPLNEVIAEDVARESAALPLLSYLLDQLYRADVIDGGGSILTFATYERLGRLEGAIATKAEAVLEVCAADECKALGEVLFLLVQISAEDGDIAHASARRVPLSVFPDGSPQRRLVNALLSPDARLLVTDAEPDGAPTVCVAHEALISRWQRARDFVRANAEALKIRRRIEERYTQWRELKGVGPGTAPQADPDASWSDRVAAWRPRFGREQGLLTDIDLADGQRLLREHRSATEPHLVDYIERSVTNEKRTRDRAFRALAMGAAAVTVLAIFASLAALTARFQATQALQAQARLLTEAASEHLAANDVPGAEAIILEVLKGRKFGDPRSAAAVSVLEEARAADLELAVLSGHDGEVNSAAFSPDGRRIVTAGDDGTARVWDSVTGAQRLVLPGHGGVVLAAAFSPDGARIVTASKDKTARIWDSATGKSIAVLSGHTDGLLDAVFSPDGRRILTTSVDKTARLWNANTGAPQGVIPGGGATFTTAVFSPDGRRILTASTDRTARVWDSVTFAPLVVLRGHGDTVNSASWSPDGRRIVTASTDRTARVWDAATGEQLAVLADNARSLFWAAFSPDGRRIVTASGDRTARIWDAATDVQIAVLSGHTDQLAASAYSPDGKRIVTASQDGTARVWDAATGGQIAVLPGHAGAVASAVYSPDGRRIATASSDKTARIWDAASGAELHQFVGHADAVLGVAYSPDGRRIATTSLDRTARVWDAVDGRQIAVCQHPREIFLSVVFSPDGRDILTASADDVGTARIFDAATCAEVSLLSGGGQLYFADYSPDGRRAVTASNDKIARIWDVATGKQIAALKGHGEDVVSAQFSPDGRRIVTSSVDRTARVWNASTGAQTAVLLGHGDLVYSAAWSPDGRLIATASNDRTARIWDAATGEQLAILAGHGDSVFTARFSPDGARIVTASIDRTARIWDARALASSTTEVQWARAAQTDALSGVERARLGLPPIRAETRRGGPWPGVDDKAADPASLGRVANSEELAALDETPSRRAALLLAAFRHYAQASYEAQQAGWPDAAWRHWRYRRATLARVLAREGMIRQVAQTYSAVTSD